MLLGNHEAQSSQISDIPLFVLLTCCVYVNILFPEPFHLLSLSLSPSLSDECQRNKTHFKALWSFHNNLPPTIPWEVFLVVFFVVCSAVGIGKGEKKNKTFFNCYFWASFPFSTPWGQVVLCPLCSFSLGLNLLPFILASTSATRPPSDSGRFASDPKKRGNLCTRTQGLMRFTNIIYISPPFSDVEQISVSGTKGAPVVLGGKKIFHTPLLSFIDWLVVQRMVWGIFWLFYFSLRIISAGSLPVQASWRTWGPEGSNPGSPRLFFFNALPTSAKHQTVPKPGFFSWGEPFGVSSCWEGIVLWGSPSKPPCRLCEDNVLLHPHSPASEESFAERSGATKQSKLFWGNFFGEWLPQFPLLRKPWGGSLSALIKAWRAHDTELSLLFGFLKVDTKFCPGATFPKPRFLQPWEWGGSGNPKAKFLKESFYKSRNFPGHTSWDWREAWLPARGGKKRPNPKNPQHFSCIIKAKGQWRDCIKMFLEDQFMLLYISPHFSAGTQRTCFTHLLESPSLKLVSFSLVLPGSLGEETTFAWKCHLNM